jgi:predicted metal-dependent RNase
MRWTRALQPAGHSPKPKNRNIAKEVGASNARSRDTSPADKKARARAATNEENATTLATKDLAKGDTMADYALKLSEDERNAFIKVMADYGKDFPSA